tara:strand:- start:516 stop:725 length:210 start_codon:yes stop_codon:yes gene_type:complete
MSWSADLETLRQQNIVLSHHKAILGYTQKGTRKAIAEMRASTGPMADVLHQRADECEQALDALLEFHNG